MESAVGDHREMVRERGCYGEREMQSGEEMKVWRYFREDLKFCRRGM